MVLVKLAYRQRGIRRERVRPNAAGNYITARKYSQVFYLTFPRTEQHYIQWDAYIPPYSLPIGYIFAPPPVPGWKLLGPVSSPDTAPDISDVPEPYSPVPPPSAPALPRYPSAPIPSPPLPPLAPPFPGVTPTQPVANQLLSTGVVEVGPTPVALRPRGRRSKVFTILAAETNTAEVWILQHPNQLIGYGFPLKPGASVTLTLDDMGKVWLISGSAGQKVYFLAEA
jgi:hypothetical protein